MRFIAFLITILPLWTMAQIIPDFPISPPENHTLQIYQNNMEKSKDSRIPLFHKAKDIEDLHLPVLNKNMVQGDTLYIMNDSTITGAWDFNGNIAVIDTGKLIFTGATATINGDLIVWGSDARCDILNSTLAMPQAYFYQRSMITVGDAVLNIENSTLNFNGLPHNCVIGENGTMNLKNVYNSGFRTCGLSSTATINIDEINEAGEFVITGNSSVNIKNADHVLLWHHFPDGAIVSHKFPDGATVDSYDFSNALPGVLGVNYTVNIDTCTDVMWALMPERNTNITIDSSYIRSIGLWFNGHDTIPVSGLVNQSNYNQTIGISDRTLTLQTCSVRTWSLYPFDSVYIDVTASIVGEIGAFGHSEVQTNGIMVDGSGGYFFASDETVVVGGFTTTGTSVRSEKKGIMLYVYGNVMMGSAEALDSSILIVMQSILPSDPIYRNMACAWFGKIDGPYSTYLGQDYPVMGSAWIDKDAASPLMDFDHYKLSYQKVGVSTWTDIGTEVYTEKRHDTLGVWQTSALTEEGTYMIRLELTDDQTVPFTAEAQVQINVLPAYLNIDDNNQGLVRIYPNPANDMVHFENLPNSVSDILIFDETGKLKGRYSNAKTINISELSSGIYLCFFDSGMEFLGRIVKK
ncbi:MAG: T9SS type A sorting domain-containing protein [Bacteroidales bacterium]|nr:T9SS type A sorting domain-containing protein [Bacteroidales bacterium]